MAGAIQGAWGRKNIGRCASARVFDNLPHGCAGPAKAMGEERPARLVPTEPRSHRPGVSAHTVAQRSGGIRDEPDHLRTRAGRMEPAGPVDPCWWQCRLPQPTPALAARSAWKQRMCRFSDRQGARGAARPGGDPVWPRPLLEALVGESLAGLPRFGHRSLRAAGSARRRGGGAAVHVVARTGYTGEDGFELLLGSGSAGQALATTC